MKGIFSKPNQITCIRILLIPIFVIFLLMEMPYGDYIAAFIFIILAASDALDGYIARKKQQVTGLGKILDPIADKLLISTALIFLIGRIELWMAVVIIARELIITAARICFLPKKVVIAASNLGKIKTISQIIAILAVILNVPFNWWIMLLAVIITVASGLDYLVKMSKLIGGNAINLPNIITTFRLLLIPLFITNLMKMDVNFALMTLTIIVLSDKLDGISARVAKQITRFGRIYDAFVDFVVIVSSLVTFYIIGLIEFFWILIFAVAVIALIITKISYHTKFKEETSNALGKIVVGISYVAVIAIIIDFAYKFEILVIIAILTYIYILADIYKIFIKKA
jgi:CDP-diacylglycerol--glycerol-3-phosphate 3-phosphatidyltransferase|tara:strand:+ start:82838 stop:83860 length:1023 start_codon:yes stop_codon:yes gene_type:complete